MIVSSTLKPAFQKAVESGTAQALEELVQIIQAQVNPQIVAEWERAGAAKGFGVRELLQVPLTFCRATLLDPAFIIEAFDGISRAWLQNQPELLQEFSSFKGDQSAKAPEALWQLFWEDVAAAPLRVEPARISQFNAALDLSVRQTYERMMLEGKGVAQALKSRFRRSSGSFSLESLADYPEGTLGYSFYHQLTDNNLSVEIVKDRPYQRYEDESANWIALRLYQTHDIWHVLLGYTVSGLDEISLQAFQLAQVPTTTSARLLALVITRAVLKGFYAPAPVFNAIFKGWQHGRQTTGLVAIEWEALWHQPLSELRSHYQIGPV